MPDDPAEGVLDALGEPGGDERPGDRRAAECVIVADREGRDLRIDRQPEVPQQDHRPLEPLATATALGGEGRLERLVVRIHAEPEDVELALPQSEVAGHEGVDLDTRDEGHPGWHRPGSDDVTVAGERVVVREREVRTPAADAASTSAPGVSTPSERVV